MTLRMHPVSAAQWAELAALRHPIDLTADEPRTAKPDRGRRRREHARIQAQVNAIAATRTPVSS